MHHGAIKNRKRCIGCPNYSWVGGYCKRHGKHESHVDDDEPYVDDDESYVDDDESPPNRKKEYGREEEARTKGVQQGGMHPQGSKW